MASEDFEMFVAGFLASGEGFNGEIERDRCTSNTEIRRMLLPHFNQYNKHKRNRAKRNEIGQFIR